LSVVIQTSQTGGQQYSDTSPFSIPWCYITILAQVKHMASLLSESEAENARLIQLAQVLKEEIRSYRRSEERSKHIDNLEYVKNVILKVGVARPSRLSVIKLFASAIF